MGTSVVVVVDSTVEAVGGGDNEPRSTDDSVTVEASEESEHATAMSDIEATNHALVRTTCGH